MTKAKMKALAMSGLVAIVAVAVANRIPRVSNLMNNK